MLNFQSANTPLMTSDEHHRAQLWGFFVSNHPEWKSFEFQAAVHCTISCAALCVAVASSLEWQLCDLRQHIQVEKIKELLSVEIY